MELNNISAEILKNVKEIITKPIKQENNQNVNTIDESIYNQYSLDIVKEETINVTFTWCDNRENDGSYFDTKIQPEYEINKREQLSPYIVTFNCTECDFTCSDINTLVNHKLVHRKNSHYICSGCGDKFNNEKCVNQCMKKHKGNELNLDTGKMKDVSHSRDVSYNSYSASQKFTCGLCDHSCIGSSFFVEHMNIHIRESRNCNQCNTKFVTHEALIKHLKGQYCQSHPITIPISYNLNHKVDSFSNGFQCLECQRRFISKDILDKHIVSHRKLIYTNKIECSECEYKCDSRNDLEQHMYSHESNHSEDEQFECSLCDYVSSSEKDIQEHSLMCNVNGISESYENYNGNGLRFDQEIDLNVTDGGPKKGNSNVNSLSSSHTKNNKLLKVGDAEKFNKLENELSDKINYFFVGNSGPIIEVESSDELGKTNNKPVKISQIAPERLHNLSIQSFDIFIPFVNKLEVNNTIIPVANVKRSFGCSDNDVEGKRYKISQTEKNNENNLDDEKDNKNNTTNHRHEITRLFTTNSSEKRKIKETLVISEVTEKSHERNEKSKEVIKKSHGKKKLNKETIIKSKNVGMSMYLSLNEIKRQGSLIKESKEIKLENKLNIISKKNKEINKIKRKLKEIKVENNLDSLSMKNKEINEIKKQSSQIRQYKKIKEENTSIYIPEGWERKIVERPTKSGDVYYYSPDGKKHRSKFEIITYLTQPFASVTGKVVDVDRLCFGLSGFQQPIKNKKPYTCYKCEYITLSLLHIKFHLVCHTDSDHFYCSECMYTSKRKDELYAHMKIHVVIYVYYCKECEYTSTNKVDFIAHKSKHERADSKKSDAECANAIEISESDNLANQTKFD